MVNDNPSHSDRESPPTDTVNRRTVLKATGGLGAATAIAGCSGGGDGNSSNEVHFLTDESSDGFRNFFSTVKEDFESETDYTVNMEFVGVGGSAEDRLAQLTQAGDPPEVFLTGASQAALFLNQDAIAPVSDAFSSISDRFGSPSDSWRLQSDGEDYIAPLWGNIGITWYRTDIMSDQTPNTWDSLLTAAQNADSSSLRGSFVPAGQDICTDLYVLGWAYSNGARVCERQGGNISVIMTEGDNRQRWLETLQFFQDLHQYSPNNSDAGCSQMSQALASESAAHTWYVGSRPKYQPISQDAGFASDISAIPQPTPESGQDPTTAALAEGLVSFKGSNTEAANEYIDFLFQTKYLNEIYFLTPLQNVPAFPEISETDSYQTKLESTVSDTAFTQEDVEATNTASQNIVTLASETSPPNPYSGAILGSRKLSELVYDVTVGEMSPSEALETRASEIESAIENARS
ncbi:hypothetical protein BV210_18085 (plasmid) [Halorientalis sp. IM1011]|uniref:substrate-binding domain-containing protein n=1 Tax=Halorientalis sp. IM1011 TaxID=1932360 RepID=UPI00097CCFFB|nr:substrate-binding domain-containing protein [Halorientalis sp. IM1011]AQL44674.1 hypothetical protein BV210_18085 [Halorientalis sp. IM1011]